MKAGGFGDGDWVAGEGAASLAYGFIEVIDGFKVGIGEGFVDERPEVFGGLEFRTVWGLKDQPHAIWHGKVFRAVPSGVVELENDDAVAARAGLAGEGGEQALEEALVDAVRHKPHRLAAGWGHEGGDIEPFITVMAGGLRPFADRRPDAAADRLQPDAVLVRGPDFDWNAGVAGLFFGPRIGEFFLKAAASSGDADFGFRGRGDWIDQPIALSASQPRCGESLASPSCPAIQLAALALVHRPPDGGGALSRSFKAAKSPGVSTEGFAPLLRRRSPSATGPSPL